MRLPDDPLHEPVDWFHFLAAFQRIFPTQAFRQHTHAMSDHAAQRRKKFASEDSVSSISFFGFAGFYRLACHSLTRAYIGLAYRGIEQAHERQSRTGKSAQSVDEEPARMGRHLRRAAAGGVDVRWFERHNRLADHLFRLPRKGVRRQRRKRHHRLRSHYRHFRERHRLRHHACAGRFLFDPIARRQRCRIFGRAARTDEHAGLHPHQHAAVPADPGHRLLRVATGAEGWWIGCDGLRQVEGQAFDREAGPRDL